jgi:hypothetical protein
MIKKLILIAATLIATSVSAQTTVQLHGLSWHKTGTFNERNYGIGIRNQINRDLAFQVGYYKNSVNKDTFYSVINYTPLTVGPVAVGVFGGFASGYKSPLVGGAMVNIGYVTVRIIPEIRNVTPLTVGLEVGIPF